jgi:hypothetical protein
LDGLVFIEEEVEQWPYLRREAGHFPRSRTHKNASTETAKSVWPWLQPLFMASATQRGKVDKCREERSFITLNERRPSFLDFFKFQVLKKVV